MFKHKDVCFPFRRYGQAIENCWVDRPGVLFDPHLRNGVLNWRIVFCSLWRKGRFVKEDVIDQNGKDPRERCCRRDDRMI
jgi:hypothetical protein